MEVQKIGDGSPPVNWNAANQVQRLAEENAAAQLRTRGVPIAPSPIQADDRTYSPALYAQAAQFQLYTQSGTLAAMLSSTGGAVSAVTSPTDTGDELKPVESADSSAKLDMRA